MKDRFEFRLEKVLDYKQQKEKEAKNELASALSSLHDAKSKLDLLQQEKQQIFSREPVKNGVNVQEKVLQVRYCDYLDKRIGDQSESIRVKEHQVHDRRSELIAKTKDKKVLSALKDRQSASFDQERSRTEQKQSDEMAVNRFLLNQSRN